MKKQFTGNIGVFFFALIFYNLLTGCSKKDAEAGMIDMVSNNNMQIGFEGGEQTVKFICNQDWSISSDASWLTFPGKTQGSGNAIVKINALANNASNIRKANLIIRFGGITETIEVVQVAKSISIAFKHPSILYTAEELLELKGIITANSSVPITTTYNNLMNRCNTALNYTTNPYTGNSPSEFIEAIFTPGSYSRDLAMAYWFTGDKKYAQKSVQLIKEWAIKCKGINYQSSAGNSMYLTRGMFPMVCAYDMLIDEEIIDAETKAIITSWFGILYTEGMASINLWEENDYFQKQYYQNHNVAHAMGIMVLGFAIEDDAMVQFALNSPSNPRDIHELIAGCIFMDGDKPHVRENASSAAPVKGEIYDRYRHQTGPVRGLQYAHLTQTLLATVARMCHNNGIDLFAYTAPTGENIRFPFEYYSDFYRFMDSCIKSGYYCGETDRMTKAGDNPGMYELGLRYYPDSQPVKSLLSSGNFNRTTAYMDLLGYTRFFSAPVDK